jgi:phytanoyl-CoA hydroxylase
VDDPGSLLSYFAEQGYVVVRSAVPRELCTAATEAFAREVKPSRRYFKRHESGGYERHVFTPAGFMKYPIMNIQDLDVQAFHDFREQGLALVTHPTVINSVMTMLLGEPGRIAHTMYFDGNQET